MKSNLGIDSKKSIWNRLFLTTITFLFFVSGNAQQQYKVNASSLNVRSSPSKKGVKTGRIDGGEVVNVYEMSKDSSWAYIRINSLSGWVSTAYLEPVATEDAAMAGFLSKKEVIAKKIMDFLYEYSREIYWIIFSLALLISVPLAFVASKRDRLTAHLWRMGFIIVIMVGLKNYVWVLRWIYPALVCMLLFYALLFSVFSATKVAKVIRWGIWVWCFGAVWVFLNANPSYGVMIWWVAVLDGFVNWALFQLLSKNLESYECPFCNEYAEHTLVSSDLISRELRTEYAGEKTIGSGRVTFSSSDIPDETFSIKSDRYNQYQYDKYKEEYRCVHCRKIFPCIRGSRTLVATDV